MAIKEEYRRLPGKGRRRKAIWGFTRLYLGKDHILGVYNAAYTEDYRRFYFKDIRAIVIAATPRRERLAAIYGGGALLLLLIAFMKGGNWGIFFMILAVLFLFSVALNWHRGPTCSCRLYTAASREDLPSLGRLRNAQQVVRILKPLIEESQGSLAPEDAGTTAQEAPSGES